MSSPVPASRHTPPSDPFRVARDRMVTEQIERRGVRDPGVLRAMRDAPREAFLEGILSLDADQAYADNALPIGRGQTLSQPYIVAAMTEALQLPTPGTAQAEGADPGRPRVLEIGTGSGYQTLVLARLLEPLGGEVWSIERDPVLAEEARDRLERLGVANARFLVGDGSLGWPEGAPWDAILVTAGAPSVPPALRAQLCPGGRLVVPVGPRDEQVLLRLTRAEGGADPDRTDVLMACRFVPLVGEEGW